MTRDVSLPIGHERWSTAISAGRPPQRTWSQSRGLPLASFLLDPNPLRHRRDRGWLVRREELDEGPRDWPWPKVPEHAPAVLFVNPRPGDRWTATSMSRVWKRACKKVGVEAGL